MAKKKAERKPRVRKSKGERAEPEYPVAGEGVQTSFLPDDPADSAIEKSVRRIARLRYEQTTAKANYDGECQNLAALLRKAGKVAWKRGTLRAYVQHGKAKVTVEVDAPAEG